MWSIRHSRPASRFTALCAWTWSSATWNSGTPYPYAIDESGGTGAGYDRFYLDLNRDGRLSDEAPIAPLRELPEGKLFKQKWASPVVWFGSVTFSSTDAEGIHTVETLPRLLIEDSFAILSFTATKARKGEVEIGGRRFNATILNSYPLGTRWDRPRTIVTLEARGIARMSSWFLSNRLMSMHMIGDQYWRFSITPAGDRFFVELYQGGLGIVKIDLGGWPFRKTTFSGALLARDKAVAVGHDDGSGIHQPVGSCEVPVGDYSPSSLDVHWGPMAFSLASIPLDGGMSGSDANSFYTLQIRKDKPCILDLSRTPEVLFTAPREGMWFRPGNVLQVMAVLANPQSHVMILNLSRKSREQASPGILTLIGLTIVAPLGVWLGLGRGKRGYRYLPVLSGVGVVALGGYLGGLFAVNTVLHPDRFGPGAVDALRPQVTIARANGEIVAEGAMPFG